VTNSSGDALAAASIEVRLESTGNLVSLFEDVDGNTGLTNPFNADSEGFFRFYVDDGIYKITATSGSNTRTFRNVQLQGFDQGLKTDDAVTFATVNTGQGANELYPMNQAVRTSDSVTFATVNTGQGANELYAMDQNVRTTDSPSFAGLTIDGNSVDPSEEGKYSPTLLVGATSQTLSTNDGYYYRTGNQVTVYFAIQVNGAISGSGSVTLGNFPFSVDTAGGKSGATGAVGRFGNFNLGSGFAGLTVRASPVGAQIRKDGQTNNTSISDGDISSDFLMEGSLTYITDAT